MCLLGENMRWKPLHRRITPLVVDSYSILEAYLRQGITAVVITYTSQQHPPFVATDMSSVTLEWDRVEKIRFDRACIWKTHIYIKPAF